MPNVSTTVPNLIQGVSQQSPSLRFNGQCEAQTNAVGSVLKGLIKRPYAQLVDSIDIASEYGGISITNKDYYFFINRGESIQTTVGADQGQKTTERYVGIVYGAAADASKLRIFNLDTGAPATITLKDAAEATVSTAAEAELPDYFDCPGLDRVNYIKSATYADTTYLLNTTVTAAKNTTSRTNAHKKHDALAFIKIGAQGTKYQLKFNDSDTGSGITPATISLTYSSRSWWGGSPPQAWYVSAVSITASGSGYDEAPAVLFEDDDNWIRKPVIRLSISATGSGAVESTEIVDAGIYNATTAPGSTSLFSVTGGYGVVSVSTEHNANPEQIATEYIANALKEALENVSTSHGGITKDLVSWGTSGADNYTSTVNGSTIFIQRANDEDFAIRNAMEQWSNTINSFQGNLRNFGASSPTLYKSNAQVTQFSKTGVPIRVYNFVGIFPTEVAAIEMDWAADAVSEFTVTFTYDYWEVSGGITGTAGGN